MRPSSLFHHLGICLLAASLAVPAWGKPKRRVVLPGARAVVVDERLSALRARPDVQGPLEQRLRRGRVVGVLGALTARGGVRYLRVAATRNTAGWVLADAVVRPGHAADAARLLRLIEDTEDDYARARLARLAEQEFRGTATAVRARALRQEAGERIADKLTRDARRRLGEADEASRLPRRVWMLSFAGLDRYNRIGMRFDYDAETDRIVYVEAK